MINNPLSKKAENYLKKFCREIPTRQVGSKGNQTATDFFASIVASFGFETESPVFDCIDWMQEGAHLSVNSIPFKALVSPYSLGCHVNAPLVIVSAIEELVTIKVTNKIILFRGEIAKEQLMPKNFPFYNPEEHKRIIQLLEAKKPQAIIAATTRNPELAGAVYPFPLIEDGDFDIPSVYMTEEEGNQLAEYLGKEISLEIRAKRSPSTGCNVIARKNRNPGRRIVLFAHIDAKDGTPGATDNATGVIVLLLLAELLADYAGQIGIEIVALNGEDYYSAPGEKQWLKMNQGKFDEIILGINIDGVGYRQGKTAFSLYDCPPAISNSIKNVFSTHDEMIEGEPWYQGDHSLFLMNRRSALTITSEQFNYILTELAHTPKDNPEIVDTTKLVDIAVGLRDLFLHLNHLQV